MCFTFSSPLKECLLEELSDVCKQTGQGLERYGEQGRNFKSQVSFPFVIIIHVRSPLGKSLSALKHA